MEARSLVQGLSELLDELPEDLQRQVFTHASWTDRSSDSYTRLAFLGDSVLGLAITAHLYPRLEAEHYGAGHLTKIRAATVSWIGFCLLATGIVLMIPFGLVPMIWGALLAAVIVLYDVWHKGNPLSPIVMGLCRALVYIGTGVAVTGSTSHATIVGAVALASHVAGITYAAKQESLDRMENLWPLALLAVPLFVALPAVFSGWIVIVAFLLLLAADALAIQLLVRRLAPGAVPLAVSGLIAAICLVDALAIALAGGGVLLVAICMLGYPLTRLFQKSIPGT